MKRIMGLLMSIILVSSWFLGTVIGVEAAGGQYLADTIYVGPYEQIFIDWSSAYMNNPSIASYRYTTQCITVINDYGIVAQYTADGTACYLPGLQKSESEYIIFVGSNFEFKNSFAIFKVIVEEGAVQCPSATINTTNEYYLSFNEGEAVYVSFWNSYDDESDSAKWWRDNYYHYICMRKVTDFNDYNGYIQKNGSIYEWGDAYYSDEYVDIGWYLVADADNIYYGQTDFIIGQLPAGKYVVIVCSDMGWQNGQIIAKYNIDVKGQSTQSITVKVNGKNVLFDVPPQMINGKLMVSVREIFETMGAEVWWEEETQKLKSSKFYPPSGGIITAVFQLGSNIMYTSFGNPAHYIDTPPVIVNGSVMVPVEAAGEAFNFNVNWDKETNIVYIWE